MTIAGRGRWDDRSWHEGRLNIKVHCEVNPYQVYRNSCIPFGTNIWEPEWRVEIVRVVVLLEDERVVGLRLEEDNLVVDDTRVGAPVSASGVAETLQAESCLDREPCLGLCGGRRRQGRCQRPSASGPYESSQLILA